MSSTKPWPNNQTRLAGVIGYPARYSLSPAIHNAAYKDLGLDIAYVVLPVLPQRINEAVQGVRALDLLGVSVTIPHKESVISCMDELSPRAEALRAVNTIVHKDGRLIGHNTDGGGFVNSLKMDLGFDPAGKRCLVIGAGGAAKAVIAALSEAGATDVAVLNRSFERADLAKNLAGPVGRVGSVDDVADADLIVNATPVGMEGATIGTSVPTRGSIEMRSVRSVSVDKAGQLPLDVTSISDKHLVADLITHPSETPLLREAAARGARTVNGLGMLVHQAAAQIELWTGKVPNIELMKQVANF